MATNVEIKARARDFDRQRVIAAGLADGGPELLEQTDTFFRVSEGRLKLRRFAADRGELIFYRRPDRPGPKPSDYSIVATGDPAALGGLLAAALGVRGVVSKLRWLYLVGQTRVHFDQVAGLGEFIELEVVLRPGQSAEEGAGIAANLCRRLDVRDEDLIDRAYIDLLESRP